MKQSINHVKKDSPEYENLVNENNIFKVKFIYNYIHHRQK